MKDPEHDDKKDIFCKKSTVKGYYISTYKDTIRFTYNQGVPCQRPKKIFFSSWKVKTAKIGTLMSCKHQIKNLVEKIVFFSQLGTREGFEQGFLVLNFNL